MISLRICNKYTQSFVQRFVDICSPTISSETMGIIKEY